ncbi:MAG: S9 family peptidase [Crocinitomicaceae bacterium]|nr:S9 family peptidase [Crocinitomicaceae bacterium]MBK8924616.1 S9 family peptidase [Crocinitomicaceae bacterium]
MRPPLVRRIEKKLSVHGDTRIDPYFWLNDRENPAVISYLKKENIYCNYVLKPVSKLREKIFHEMKSRMKEEESTAPFFKNGYWYYERYEKGKEHPVFCRKKETLNSKEEIILDANKRARGQSYYELVSFTVSPDNKWLALTEDLMGRRLYQISIKNLETGDYLSMAIQNTGSDLAWHNDNETLYFSVKDKKTLRPFSVKSVSRSTKKTEIHFTEKDETFYCGLSRSKDDQYIFIGSYSTTTSEFRFKRTDDYKRFEIFLKRKRGHEYYPDSAGDHCVIKSNLAAENFKLVKCDIKKREPRYWQIIQKHDKDVLIEDFEVYKKHLIVQEKKAGLTRLRIYYTGSYRYRFIPPFEDTYTLSLGTNPEFEFNQVRVSYSSLTTPLTTYDIDLKTLQKTIAGQTKVLGGFKTKDYKSERIWITSHDGVKVPVSLVYHRDHFTKRGKNPLLLYAYGSYGESLDPYFSSARLSLLNRGFVFAIAHVRGGEELGRRWYEDGKLLKKKNTFHDFIACAEGLIKLRYASRDKVFAMGGSAGGLLMGAVANMRPDLWRGIVSNVPFVDVVTTMLDTSIPLTTGEFDEWGNPAEKKYYRYMKSYSPYDNIRETQYPAMLVTSGLHDSQVQYWEPTKYVAKLRALKTDKNLLLLYTNMKAGHGGASGRFESLKEIALEYTFILFELNRSSE